MHPQPYEPPVEIRPTKTETIALAYRRTARGDAWSTLVQTIEDVLSDRAEAECRTMQRDRLILHGYVRGGVPVTATGAPA